MGSCSEIYKEDAFYGKFVETGYECVNAAKLSAESFCLLVHHRLSEKDINDISDKVISVLKNGMKSY